MRRKPCIRAGPSNQPSLAVPWEASVTPSVETISSGKYPVSRPLFIYVKKAHLGVIPGLKEFVAEYVSDRSMGSEGYLADKGLIPLSLAEQGKVRSGALDKIK